RDQAADEARAPRQPAIARNRLERADVVEAEIARVVVALGERDPFTRQRAVVGAEVQRLTVGDDAVEVEDYRSQHESQKSKGKVKSQSKKKLTGHSRFPLAASPATFTSSPSLCYFSCFHFLLFTLDF